MNFVFFFQAEDGIRDLVRSRGLGDVYKRQELPSDKKQRFLQIQEELSSLSSKFNDNLLDATNAVSYTHLTLPTSDLV